MSLTIEQMREIVAGAPEWAVFNLRWWDRDALLDWITPTVAVVAVALLSMHW